MTRRDDAASLPEDGGAQDDRAGDTPHHARAMPGPGDDAHALHRMPFGAQVLDDGRVRFRLWAPSARRVTLLGEGGVEHEMPAIGSGWFEHLAHDLFVGARYRYRIDDRQEVPDPAARFQPGGVHGWSEVIDPRAYRWRANHWRGVRWEAVVLYEMHVGAFTADGTFRAAIERLDHLAALGVTAIELMPVAQFPGDRNWGYDGVLPFAPAHAYGRPDDLKALIDAAHARGLAVFLDVVYNHFGPEGNHLSVYAREFFTERHHTPWGAAINFDAPAARPVREFVIDNAPYWIHEFRCDGLRVDAVHAIIDAGAQHVLEELAERVHATVGDGRHVHLVLENAANEARLLARDGAGRARWYAAQWNDDLHHGLHVAASGEDEGYYAPYAGSTARLARALAEGFAFQGEWFGPLGAPRGEPSAALPPTAFVAFLQNHDQIGNRAFGERITAIAAPPKVRIAAAITLLAPQIPLLFMGEEWAASTPFPFFCAFDEPLATAVRDGRRAEFAHFAAFADPARRERIPDPTAPATFAAAKLIWGEAARAPHAEWLAWYRALLVVRRAEIVPRLAGIGGFAGSARAVGAHGLDARWRMADGAMLLMQANFGDAPAEGFAALDARVIWSEGAPAPATATRGACSLVCALR